MCDSHFGASGILTTITRRGLETMWCVFYRWMWMLDSSTNSMPGFPSKISLSCMQVGTWPQDLSPTPNVLRITNQSSPFLLHLKLKTVLRWIRGKLRWREKGTQICINQSRLLVIVSKFANDSIISILNTGPCCDACRLSFANNFKILEGRITQ